MYNLSIISNIKLFYFYFSQSDHLFIGGNIEEFQKGSLGLRGCIHQVFIDSRDIDLEKEPIKTANIVPCQE